MQVSVDEVLPGTVTGIIQHPLGRDKVIEAGPIIGTYDNLLRYDDIDTQGGSSGSPVIATSCNKIVGIHVLGGCEPNTTGYNCATALKAIAQYSPTIKALLEKR